MKLKYWRARKTVPESMNIDQVYAVAGAKGGVGKTTTSINVGATLAEMGYDVVVVELDLAMANLVDFLDIDVEESTTFHDVLAGADDVEDAIYEAGDGLAVVPSGTDLAGYSETDLDRLPATVETLRWPYDVVILDTPAGLSEEVIRPLLVADEVILVSTPRVSSVRNANNTIQLADRVDTDVEGLVLTKSGTGKSPGAHRIAEFLEVELLGHVPEDDAVPHSQDRGKPVVVDTPRSGAAVAYRKIARKLVDADPTTVPEPETTTGPPAPDEREQSVGRTDGSGVHAPGGRPRPDTTPAGDEPSTAPPSGSGPTRPTGSIEPGHHSDEKTDAESTNESATDHPHRVPSDDGDTNDGIVPPPDGATSEPQDRTTEDDATATDSVPVADSPVSSESDSEADDGTGSDDSADGSGIDERQSEPADAATDDSSSDSLSDRIRSALGL